MQLAEADPSTVRQVKKAGAAFDIMPETIPTYDHFTPVAWLIRNSAQYDPDEIGKQQIVATLKRIANTSRP